MRNSSDLEPAEFIDVVFRKIATPQQQDDLTAVAVQLLGHIASNEAKQVAKVYRSAGRAWIASSRTELGLVPALATSKR